MGRLKNSDLPKLIYFMIAIIAIYESISGNFYYLIAVVLSILSLIAITKITSVTKRPIYDLIFSFIVALMVIFIILLITKYF